MRVFGYIRFSFFGRNDTKIGRTMTDELERFNTLYDPIRMKERFYFFENITIPSLKTQTDQDFKIIVVSSHVMPDEHKTRLEDICAEVPQIEVMYSDAEHITYALNPKIEELTADIKEKTLHFRLDDDDAICTQMIAMLKKAGQRCKPNDLITFPRGFYLASDEEKSYVLRKFEPYIAIAWALVNGPGQIRNPYQGKHGSHYSSTPSYMDPTPYAYIHVAHDSSDTKAKQDRKLRRALAFDTTYGSERAMKRTEQLIQRNFPGFSTERLEQIIANAPGRKRSKSKVEIERPDDLPADAPTPEVSVTRKKRSATKAAE